MRKLVTAGEIYERFEDIDDAPEEIEKKPRDAFGSLLVSYVTKTTQLL